MTRKPSAAATPPRRSSIDFARDRAQVGAPAGAAPRNLFEGNPDFEKLNKGDPKNGAVAFLPQLHLVPGIGWNSDPQLCRDILASQMEVLQQLQKHKPRHVIDEPVTAESSELWDKLPALMGDPEMHELMSTMADVVRTISEAKDVDDVMAKVDPDWLAEFMNIGATGAHAMAQVINGSPPVKMHASQPPHILANWSTGSRADDLIHRQREQVIGFMAPKIIEKNPGQAIFLVYGSGHVFDQAFAGPDAPALYRFKSTATAKYLPPAPP